MMTSNQLKTIFVIGAFSRCHYTYSSSFYRVISEMGYNVHAFDYRRIYVSIKKLNSILINQMLRGKIQKLKPNLIFIIKGEIISSKTIRWIKRTYPETILINFYPDNPFVFWNGNSNQEVLNSLPYYDYFLSWSYMLMSALESAGCKKVLYFPFAYDEKIFTQNSSVVINSQESTTKTCHSRLNRESIVEFEASRQTMDPGSESEMTTSDVSFVGTWDHEREWWLTHLIKNRPDVDLGIWGNNWDENLPVHSLLRTYIRGAAIYPPESIILFQKSLINLNFIRKQNMTSHNMRTFEIPASGGFMLTQRTYEQSEILFKEDDSSVCFSTPDELIKKIDFYLKQPSIRRAVIHKSSTVVQRYTLQNYIKNLFKKIIWREDEHSHEAKDCDTHNSQLL